MILDLKDISVREGDSLPFDYELDLSDITVFGEKPFVNPFKVKGRVFNRAGVLELSAEACTDAEFKCARCAESFSESIDVRVFRVLSCSSSDEADTDNLQIHDFSLDLDTVIADEVVLENEMVHLCREDCKGLCSICGMNLNKGTCSCSNKEIDPRLAPLKALLNNDPDKEDVPPHS